MRLVADNLTPSDPKFARALQRRDPGPVRAIVERCLAAGCAAIDLNPGHLGPGRTERMAWLVETVQAMTALPLFLDSAQVDVLHQGARACQRPPILNALTAQADRLAQLPGLAARRGTGLVILLLDAEGHTPAGLEEKAALAEGLIGQATRAGVPWESIICDPVLPHLSWPDADARLRAAVDLVAMLGSGELLGRPVATMVGLSNLRSGLRKRIGFDAERGALSDLRLAGLTWVLANALDPEVAAAVRGPNP